MNDNSNTCILIFVKYPKDKQIKTRLAADMNETIVVDLYKRFVLDTLSTVKQAHVPFFICFHPKKSQGEMVRWLGDRYQFIPQKGRTFGERMTHGFQDAFARVFKNVVLIGSDSPDIPGIFLREAIQSLNTHDVVIGPSRDGGYYLIGCTTNSFSPLFFQGIHWSTETVFQETTTIFKKMKKTYHVLAEWNDVDTVEDLRSLIRRNTRTAFQSSHTMAFLKKQKVFL